MIPRTRTALIALGMLAALGALGALWAYAAGAIFYLLGGANPLGEVGLGTWWTYWQHYGAHEAVRGRLALAAVFGLSLALSPSVALVALALRGRRRRALHGDARFASRAEIRRAGLLR